MSNFAKRPERHAHSITARSGSGTQLIHTHRCVDQLRRKSRNPVRAEVDPVAAELAPHVSADEGDTLLMARRLLEQLEPESRRLAVLFVVDLDQGQRIEGDVYITSTGPNEPAQEWEALGGGLFTHHLLSGLRGAADRDTDGRVTLFEAYS